MVEVHGRGNYGEGFSQEAGINASEEHVLSPPLNSFNEADERHWVVEEVDLVDTDDVRGLVDDLAEVAERVEVGAVEGRTVAAGVAIVVVPLACSGAIDHSALQAVLLSFEDVANHRFAFAGSHRADEDLSGAEGTKWAKGHEEFSGWANTFYIEGFRGSCVEKVDNMTFVHNVSTW